ncbi:MAG: hypothetical protein GWP15_03290 [Nitrospirae bacterium]|nr:hypothetical protein [Nitrospirota bacterium]
MDKAIFSIQSPLTQGYTYLRKNRKAKTVEKLFDELDSLTQVEKEELITELIAYLPKDSSMAEFERAKTELANLEKNVKINDLLKELKIKYERLKPKDQVEILKLSIYKTRPMLVALRDFISQNMMEAKDVESLMVIDQAVYVAGTLCDEILFAIEKNQKEKVESFNMFLFFLLLSLEAIRRRTVKPETLYDNIAFITSFVEKTREERSVEIKQSVFGVAGFA